MSNINYSNRQNISISVIDSDKFEIPIIYFSNRNDLLCELYIEKHTVSNVNNFNQNLISKIGVKKTNLSMQSAELTGGLYKYGNVYSKDDLYEVGVYSGIILVREKYPILAPNNKAEIIDIVPVNISIIENPLNQVTEFNSNEFTQKETFGSMLKRTFAQLFIAPFFVKLDDNGNKIVTYKYNSGNQYIASFQDSVNGWMPNGTTITLFDSDTGGVFGDHKDDPSIRTDVNGKDKINPYLDISRNGKPCDYFIYHDLPIGNYTAQAEFTSGDGIKKKTEFQKIIVR